MDGGERLIPLTIFKRSDPPARKTAGGFFIYYYFAAVIGLCPRKLIVAGVIGLGKLSDSTIII